jgi:hypothetical protein
VPALRSGRRREAGKVLHVDELASTVEREDLIEDECLAPDNPPKDPFPLTDPAPLRNELLVNGQRITGTHVTPTP